MTTIFINDFIFTNVSVGKSTELVVNKRNIQAGQLIVIVCENLASACRAVITGIRDIPHSSYLMVIEFDQVEETSFDAYH